MLHATNNIGPNISANSNQNSEIMPGPLSTSELLKKLFHFLSISSENDKLHRVLNSKI